ncbi:MAG: polysaccharide deacetylase family protein [Candidatus Omnitrophica bacterium]|nr:polysaccharide deacetylase family protein [Candidatus Omnitrophota bacterium]
MRIKKRFNHLGGKAIRYFTGLVDPPALVLLYHRVAELLCDRHLLVVRPDNFYWQVEYLKKHYNLINVEEFCHILNRRYKFPPRSILITFDDGYADNYNTALPILESLRAQALFFITTSYMDSGREFWWDELEQIVSTQEKLPDCFDIINGKENNSIDRSALKDRDQLYILLHRIIKGHKPDERRQIFDQLYKMTECSYETRQQNRPISKLEVNKLSQSPSALIGAHTHTHTPLSLLNYKEQIEDIRKSKIILEEIIGKKIKYFSYPFGAKVDYNKNSVKIVRDLEFDMAVINSFWPVHRWTDIFQIPRIIIRDWKPLEFKSTIEMFLK